MKAAIFDVDGVLTDGRLYIGEHGETVKAFSTLDGHGLKLLRRAASSRWSSPGATRRRCGGAWPTWASRTRSTARTTSWPPPRRCWRRWAWTGPRWPRSATTGPTCRCWPAPASPARRPMPMPRCKAVAHHVTAASGGHGAAREFCDLLLMAARPLRRAAAGPPAHAGRGLSTRRRVAAMSVELHLPDLPEVPISLGPGARRRRACRGRWHLRVRDALSAYLPLLLMALLALATWWLVKNSPQPPGPRDRARRCAATPDYTMSDFSIDRFDATRPAEGAHRGRRAAPLPGHRPHRDRRRAHPRHRRPTAASRWRTPRARWPTATAARCSCSAAPRSRSQDADGARRWRCAASSCTPSSSPSACARTCRCRCAMAAPRCTPAAWTTTTRARPARTAGADARRDAAAGAAAGGRAMSGAAGLHHRRFQRHRPGAGRALCPGRLAAGAGGAPRRRAAGLGAGAGPGAGALRGLRRRRAPMPTASSRPARACIAAQGLPDVVIANAGISVGMDTAERERPRGDARHLATNKVGMAATFHPFVPPMRERGSGTLVGIASVAAIRGLPGHGAYCASKAGGGRLLREPARRMPRHRACRW